MPQEQFGKRDFGYGSTATLQTADAVSQPRVTTNCNHCQSPSGERTAEARRLTDLRLPGSTVSSLKVTRHQNCNDLKYYFFGGGLHLIILFVFDLY